MDEPHERWRPTRTTLVAGTLVLAGLLLTGVSWWFLLLAAAGAFGPGLLRELGWLEDRDEFRRVAEYRAGYHAFLAVGLVAFVLTAYERAGRGAVEDLGEVATFFLVLAWFTWLLSSLVSYWGPVRASTWILRIFGTVVLAFTVLSNVGPEWTGWGALLLHPLLAVPFFVLAWLAGRRPRVTGALLLAAFGFFFWFLGFGAGPLAPATQGVTFVLFLGPFLAGGLALVTAEPADEDAIGA
jgi:hypothetical protein